MRTWNWSLTLMFLRSSSWPTEDEWSCKGKMETHLPNKIWCSELSCSSVVLCFTWESPKLQYGEENSLHFFWLQPLHLVCYSHVYLTKLCFVWPGWFCSKPVDENTPILHFSFLWNSFWISCPSCFPFISADKHRTD